MFVACDWLKPVRVHLNPPALPSGAIAAIKPEAASAAAKVSLDPVARFITCPPPPPTVAAAVSAAAWDGVGSYWRKWNINISEHPRYGVVGDRGVLRQTGKQGREYSHAHQRLSAADFAKETCAADDAG